LAIRPAIISSHRSLTYAELDAHATRIGRNPIAQ
jgi:hypothetical protein